MADIARLGFSVDTSGLVRAERAIDSLSRAARGLRGVNLPVNLTGATEAMRSIDSIGRAASGLRDISVRVNVDGRQANNELRGVASTAQQSAQQISQSIANVRSQMLGLVGATGVVAAGVNIIQMADEYKNLEAKLKLTTKSQQEFIDVQTKLMTMANANRQSMSATIDLYSGIAPSLQRAGQSQENILKAVDSVNKALVVGGSNAVGSAASILQLTQALGSGVLRGDEFNSIMENGRGIALMLADALGTDVGKLRGLAEQGKLTADIVTRALIEQNDAVSKKFAQMPVTVGQAMQVVKNNLLSAVGSADAYTGASAALSESLITLSKNLGTVAEIGGVLAAVYAGRGVSALFSYVAANNAAAAAVQAAAVAEARAVQATAAAQAESASSAWAASVAKSRDAQAAVASTAAQVALTESLLAEALVQRSLADQVFLYGPQRAAIERGIASARAQHTLAIEAQTVATAELAIAQNAATGASAGATAALSAQRVAVAGVGSAMAGTSVIARGLSGAMALIGGPIGLAVLAGVGMYYYAESNNAAAKSITLANGQTLNFAETLDYVTDISNEYRTASTARQGAIREEIDNIIKLTAQRKAEAQQQLEYLNSLDAETAKGGAYEGNPFREGANNVLKWGMDVLGLDQGEARAVIKESGAQLDALTKQQGDLGKATESTTTATAASLLATQGASKAVQAHDTALKSIIESLTKQRIELENGKLAAEYYTNRLNGLTDAEARAAAGAGQYNAYLAERKRQQQALAGIDGGIKSGYLAKLDDLGLTQTGSVFDAIRVKTEAAIATNQRFESSLKSIGTTATAIGGTASQVVGILQQLGWTKNQAIGIAANLKQESEFRPSAVGDGGKAYGVAQWHPDRQANFASVMGKSIVGSSLEEQLKFLTYEMRRGNEIAAGRKLEAAATPQAAAAVVSRYYERPKDTEVEMQRRAEIATRIAAATGETASFTEKTTTALRGNTAASTDLLNVTSAYSGQFDNARVAAGDIAGLINTELQIATNGLLKTASDHTAEVTKTGYEYRQMQLAQMQLEPQMQAMVLAGESQAAYAEQYNALLRERAAIQDPSAIGDYKRGLSDQTLDKSQIESLTGLKLQNVFDEMSAATARQRQEALMSVDAWRLQKLTLDQGLSPAMARYILAQQKGAEDAQKFRQITDKAFTGLADGITNSLMGIETDWGQMIQSMIAETLKMQVIQPLISSLFGSFGIATPWATGGAFGGNGVQAYANGGAFHNSVLTKPTQFFANGGLAVAGEAGAEAVMPLTRIGGRLGVQSVGGGANVTVQNRIEIINNGSPAKVAKQEQTTDSNGNALTRIWLEEVKNSIAGDISSRRGSVYNALRQSNEGNYA